MPFKCEGRGVKAWNFHPIGDVGGQTQYSLIISLFFKNAIKRVEKEKAGRVIILTQLYEDSEDDGIDDVGNGANNEEICDDGEIDDEVFVEFALVAFILVVQ